MMQAGRLRHIATILEQTQSRNKIGQVVSQWQEYTKVWCEFVPLSVNAIIAAQSTNNQITARCVIRYRNGITSGMRLVHDDITYQIDGPPLPDPKTGRQYLTLMLKNL